LNAHTDLEKEKVITHGSDYNEYDPRLKQSMDRAYELAKRAGLESSSNEDILKFYTIVKSGGGITDIDTKRLEKAAHVYANSDTDSKAHRLIQLIMNPPKEDADNYVQ